MKLLKRKSCKGCEKCGAIQEALVDDVSTWPDKFRIKDPIDGAMYKLEITNVSHCWETGYADDYDVEFTRYYDDQE